MANSPRAVQVILPDVIVVESHRDCRIARIPRAVGATVTGANTATPTATAPGTTIAAAAAGTPEGDIAIQCILLALHYNLLVVAHELEGAIRSRHL